VDISVKVFTFQFLHIRDCQNIDNQIEGKERSLAFVFSGMSSSGSEIFVPRVLALV
jgi:hypothetical protein